LLDVSGRLVHRNPAPHPGAAIDRHTMTRRRTSILISGRGSNMMALVNAACSPTFPAEIVAVISNRPDAGGLAWAAAHQIPTAVVDHKRFAGREPFEAALQEVLASYETELVCCAGFMRLMTPGFVDLWRDRMINIHPSLLPAYKGLHTHERVLEDGARITGCTVHFVRAEMDDGPIVAQAAVPVAIDDTPDTLAARVLAAEHRLYPHALALVAGGRVTVTGERAVVQGAGPPGPTLFSPPLA
jgi:phosphoribosylglycinamide formyltransferase-1